MTKQCLKKVFLFMLIVLMQYVHAADQYQSLNVITSSDPGSNKARSFIYIENNANIPQGIKKQSPESFLRLQIPFVVDLPVPLQADETIQWQVRLQSKYGGGITLLSKYRFSYDKPTLSWYSGVLTHLVNDRNRLVFRPAAEKHRPAIYKKGRGHDGKRRKYGGGSVKINDSVFNPRLSYEIIATVKNSAGSGNKYRAVIRMDNRDMVRQEYILHYGINRYGRGDNGNLPVPTRDELSVIPKMPAHLLGNALSESRYGLMVDDGLTELAVNIVRIYENRKNELKNNGEHFLDLNKKPLPVPESELWLSGGWRNPERNEWYSNALNGIHQRGGAIDIVANEPHDDKRSAIAYWFLWQALNEEKNLDAFWQLETHGRPMITREFREDIEPKNGIPDAFDKADHMHINIKYE